MSHRSRFAFGYWEWIGVRHRQRSEPSIVKFESLSYLFVMFSWSFFRLRRHGVKSPQERSKLERGRTVDTRITLVTVLSHATF